MSSSVATFKGPTPGWTNVGIMGWGHLVSDFYCDILPILLPVLASRFGFSYSECGAIFMAFQMFGNFIQPAIGILAVRYSLNWFMPISILTGGVIVCLVTQATSAWMVWFIVLLSGLGASGFHPVAGGIMPKVTPKGHDVLATSIFIAGGNLGFATAPFLVALFLEHFPDSELIYLSFPAILTCALIFSRRLHVKEKALSSGKVSEFDIIAVIKNKAFVWFTASIGLRSLCYCAMIIYTPLLFKDLGFDTVQSAGAVMVMLISTVAGGLAMGGLSTHFGLKHLIFWSYIGSIVGMVIFLWQPGLTWVTYLALFIVGASVYGSTPVAIVWAERLISKTAAAFATSMMLGFTFGVGYILSVLTGWVADHSSLQFALGITVIPALAGAAIILLCLKEPEDRED